MKKNLRNLGYLFLVLAVWEFVTLRNLLGLDSLVFGLFLLLLSMFVKDETKLQRLEQTK